MLLQGLVLLLMFANMVAVVRAVRTRFVKGSPTWRFQLVQLGSPIAWGIDLVCCAWVPAQQPGLMALALGMLVCSSLLFRAAVRATAAHKLTWAFSTDAPMHLNQSGPYRLIRHPFYTSYILLFAAGIPATELRWLPALALVGMTGVYLHAIRTEEQKFANSALAAAYAAYKAQSGMLWPMLRTRTNLKTNSSEI